MFTNLGTVGSPLSSTQESYKRFTPTGDEAFDRKLAQFVARYREIYHCDGCSEIGATCGPKVIREGQKGHVKLGVITCIDSRARDGVLFKSPMGESFSPTIAGSVIPPYSEDEDRYSELWAAIEFKLQTGVNRFLHIGHTSCGFLGGVAAAAFGKIAPTPNLRGMIKSAMPLAAVANENFRLAHEGTEPTEKQLASALEAVNAHYSLKNLRDGIEKIGQRLGVDTQDIVYESWLFHLHRGNFFRFNDEKQAFDPLTYMPMRTDLVDGLSDHPVLKHLPKDCAHGQQTIGDRQVPHHPHHAESQALAHSRVIRIHRSL